MSRRARRTAVGRLVVAAFAVALVVGSAGAAPVLADRTAPGADASAAPAADFRTNDATALAAGTHADVARVDGDSAGTTGIGGPSVSAVARTGSGGEVRASPRTGSRNRFIDYIDISFEYDGSASITIAAERDAMFPGPYGGSPDVYDPSDRVELRLEGPNLADGGETFMVRPTQRCSNCRKDTWSGNVKDHTSLSEFALAEYTLTLVRWNEGSGGNSQFGGNDWHGVGLSDTADLSPGEMQSVSVTQRADELTVNLSADKRIGGGEVLVYTDENDRVSEDEFSFTVEDPSRDVSETVEFPSASETRYDGEYHVRVEASDHIGIRFEHDGGDTINTTATLDNDPPDVGTFDATYRTGTDEIDLLVRSDERLSDLRVEFPETPVSNVTNWSESGSGGRYEYRATVPAENGEDYRPTVRVVTDDYGNDASAVGQSRHVSYDTVAPQVLSSSLTVDNVSDTATVTVTLDDELSDLDLTVGGAQSSMLTYPGGGGDPGIRMTATDLGYRGPVRYETTWSLDRARGDGQGQFRVELPLAADTDGNVYEPESDRVLETATYDAPPEVTSLDASVEDGRATITLAADEAIGEAAVTVSGALGTRTGDLQPGGDTASATVPVGAGEATVTVAHLADTTGKTATNPTNTTTIPADETAPSVVSFDATAGRDTVNATFVTDQRLADATVTLSGGNAVTLGWDDVTFLRESSTGYEYAATASGLTPGSTTVTLTEVVDRRGNATAVSGRSQTVELDTDPPGVQSLDVLGADWDGGTATVEVEVRTDEPARSANVTLSHGSDAATLTLEGGSPFTGTLSLPMPVDTVRDYTLVVDNATDTVGNVNESVGYSRTVTVDASVPSVVSVDATRATADGSPVIEYALTADEPLAAGHVDLRVDRHSDYGGSTRTVVDVAVDGTDPTKASVGVPVPDGFEGEMVLVVDRLTPEDGEANVSLPSTGRTFRVDRREPGGASLDVGTPPGRDVPVTVSADDDLAGATLAVSNATATWTETLSAGGGAASETLGGTVTAPRDVEEDLTVALASVTDDGGNENGSPGTAARTVAVDTSVPSVVSYDVYAATVDGKRTLEVDVAADEPVERPTATVVGPDGAFTKSFGGSGSDWGARVVAPEGEVTTYEVTLDPLTATVGLTNDSLGLGTRTVTVDDVDPSVSVDVAAGDGAGAVTTGDTVRVSATATDVGLGVETVTVDAAPLGGPASLELAHRGGDAYAATFEVSAPPAADGAVSLPVAVRDGDGNAANDADAVTLDTAGPTVSAVTVTHAGGDDVVRAGDTVRVSAAVADATSGVETVTVDASPLGGPAALALTETGEDGRYVATVDVASPPADDGAVSLTVTAVDRVGLATTGSDDLSLDTAAPTVSAVTVTEAGGDDTVTAGDTVRVSAAVADATSGVETVTVDASPLGGPAALALSPDGSGTYAASFEVSSPPAADGDVSLTVTATDVAGNGATGDDLIALDTTAPAVSSVTVTEAGGDDVVRPGDTVSVSAAVADATSGLETVTVDASPLGGPASLALSPDGSDEYAATFAVASPPDDDGTVSLSVAASDVAGNDVSGTDDVTLDTAAPTLSAVTVTHAGGDDVVRPGDTVRVAVDVTDETSGVASVAVDASPLGGPASLALSPEDSGEYAATFAVANPPDGDGTVALTVTATDVAGATVTDDDGLTLDTTAPTVESVIVTEAGGDDTVTTGDTVRVAVDVADATSGVASVAVDASPLGGPASLALTESGEDGRYVATVAVTTPAAADGAVSLSVAAVDVAGNEAAGTDDITLDAAAPTFSSVTVTEAGGDDVVRPGDTVRVSAAVSDATSGLASVTVDASPLGGPAALALSPDGSGEYAATFAVASPPDDDGTVSLSVAARDVAGNDASGTDEVLLDTAAPTLSAVTVTHAGGDDVVRPGDTVRVAVAVTDETSGVASVTVDASPLGGPATLALTESGEDGRYTATVDVASPPAADGPVSLTPRVTDVAGNDATGSDDVTLDTAAPAIGSVTVTEAGGDDVVRAGDTVRVAVAVTDETSGVASVAVDASPLGGPAALALTPNGSGAFTATFGATDPPTADGPVSLTAVAVDAAGNRANGTDGVALDTTAPTVENVTVTEAGDDDTVTTGDTVRVAVDVADATSGVASVAVDASPLGGPAALALTESGEDGRYVATFEVSSPPAADGAVSLSVAVVDVAGNDAAGSDDVALDTATPEVASATVTHAGDDDVVRDGDTVRVAVDVTDATSGLASVTVDASPLGGPASVELTGSGGDGRYAATFVVTTPAADDGAVSLTVTATDVAGNDATGSDAVTLDSAAPDIERVTATETGADHTVATGDTVRVSVEATDATGDVAAVTVDASPLGGPAALALSSRPGLDLFTGSFRVRGPTASPGRVPLTVTVTDTAGNDATGSDPVTLDTSPPAVERVTATGPDGENVTAGDTVRVTAVVRDAIGGLENVTVDATPLGGPAALELTANDSGAYTASVRVRETGRSDGPVTLSVTAVDMAGHATTAGDRVTLTTPPPDEGDQGEGDGDEEDDEEDDDDERTDGVAVTTPGANGTVTAGEALSFAADTGGDANATYEWAFGDGTRADGPTPTHAYDSAGTYTVRLAVTDATGDVTAYNHTVTVDERPVPASVDIVDISPANATVTRGDPLTVVATLATTGEVADRTVTLRSNGTVLGNRTVELAGGGNTTVTFADVATDPLRPGAHALTVATADGAASAALTVERATRGRHESGVARPVFEAVAGADGVLDRADVLGMVADYATRRPTNGVALTRTQVLALVRYYAVEH